MDIVKYNKGVVLFEVVLVLLVINFLLVLGFIIMFIMFRMVSFVGIGNGVVYVLINIVSIMLFVFVVLFLIVFL